MITATNYNGRLHLGYGEENAIPQSLGKSINSYRNFISKFVTKLLDLSFEKKIDGKYYCVNKKSFQKHLQSIGLEMVDFKKMESDYQELLHDHSDSITVSRSILCEKFDHKKRVKLTKKMIFQIEKNNTVAAQRLIRKGAYLDREFFKIDDHFSYSRFAAERFLGACRRKEFFSYTPLAFAVEKKNQKLAQFISHIKQNIAWSEMKQSIEYNFRMESYYHGYRDYSIREITDIKTRKIEQVFVDDKDVISLRDSTSSLIKSSADWIWNEHKDVTDHSLREGYA